MGKTSLIDFCFADERIRDSYLTAVVDIFPARSLDEMTTLLANGVIRAIAPAGKRAVRAFLQALRSLEGVAEFDPDTGLPTFRLGFSHWKKPEVSLGEIFEFLGSRSSPSLIAMDEFQQVSQFEETNAEGLLRSFVQRTSGCHFIFAGSRRHLMQEMFLTYARPFYQSASLLELKAIPEATYAAFAEKMFEKAGKGLDPDAPVWLSQALGGNTFCLQSVMNTAFSLTKKGAVCDRAAFERALKNRVLERLSGYKEVLSWLSVKQKGLLFAIAHEKTAQRMTSAAFVERYRLGSPSIVQAARKKLLQLDLITESEGRYRLTDPFFEYAIRRAFFDGPVS